MIEQGKRLAYVPRRAFTTIISPGSKASSKKYRARVLGNLYRRAFGMHNRTKYITSERKLRTYLWLIYGCTLVGPLLACIRVVFSVQEAFWLWHFRRPFAWHTSPSSSVSVYFAKISKPAKTEQKS